MGAYKYLEELWKKKQSDGASARVYALCATVCRGWAGDAGGRAAAPSCLPSLDSAMGPFALRGPRRAPRAPPFE